tara:strand:- start:508 stop:651 length:144 start_codon:yes stop_codon:yes gene_type:complete
MEVLVEVVLAAEVLPEALVEVVEVGINWNKNHFDTITATDDSCSIDK